MNGVSLSNKVIHWNPKDFAVKQNFNKVIKENEYSNYSFVAADYSKGMKYGSNSTANVAISPQFLTKMANDPELEKSMEKILQLCGN